MSKSDKSRGRIISKSWALRLIKAGRATREYNLKPDDRLGRIYTVLTRHDCQRTDHYIA